MRTQALVFWELVPAWRCGLVREILPVELLCLPVRFQRLALERPQAVQSVGYLPSVAAWTFIVVLQQMIKKRQQRIRNPVHGSWAALAQEPQQEPQSDL